MGARYYFTATALPPLQLSTPPEHSFKTIVGLLKINLLPSDWQQVQVLRRYYDVENVRALLSKVPLDDRASLNAFELEEALHGVDGAPDYFSDFYNSFESDEERLRYFAKLPALYFQREIQASFSFFKTSFLHRYLVFERGWRLVFTAFRALKLKRDLLVELQFEDPQDPLVAQLIAQRDAQQIEPPEGFESLKPVFEQHQEDPLALQQALCLWRFEQLEEMLGTEMFTIGRILGYLAQLITIEKWLALDKKQGLQTIDSALKEIV